MTVQGHEIVAIVDSAHNVKPGDNVQLRPAGREAAPVQHRDNGDSLIPPVA